MLGEISVEALVHATGTRFPDQRALSSPGLTGFIGEGSPALPLEVFRNPNREGQIHIPTGKGTFQLTRVDGLSVIAFIPKKEVREISLLGQVQRKDELVALWSPNLLSTPGARIELSTSTLTTVDQTNPLVVLRCDDDIYRLQSRYGDVGLFSNLLEGELVETDTSLGYTRHFSPQADSIHHQ